MFLFQVVDGIVCLGPGIWGYMFLYSKYCLGQGFRIRCFKFCFMSALCTGSNASASDLLNTIGGSQGHPPHKGEM